MELSFLDNTTGLVIAVLDTRQDVITIGRSPHCDVNIPARYSTVSSLHATISTAGNTLRIIDGDGQRPSTNGLFINGVRQVQGAWLTLSPGMSFSLGKSSLASSIMLSISKSPSLSTSPHGTSSPVLNSRSPSKHGLTGNRPGNSQAWIPTQGASHKVSDVMKRRLDYIDQHIGNGYLLQKDLGAFPVFIDSIGRRRHISIASTPAGFSWIGFFFPFVVCAQIREWSYFYVTCIVFIAASLIAVSTGYDPSIAASAAISLMYGLYYPYLKHISISNRIREISKWPSIALGTFLAILASMPSFLIEFAVQSANS